MPSTLRDRLSLLPQITYQHVFRAAGADAGSAMLDFSILSVAVMTLGLILLVELGRHKLDVNATGRPFFKTVLEGVYRECKFKLVLGWACRLYPMGGGGCNTGGRWCEMWMDILSKEVFLDHV